MNIKNIPGIPKKTDKLERCVRCGVDRYVRDMKKGEGGWYCREHNAVTVDKRYDVLDKIYDKL